MKRIDLADKIVRTKSKIELLDMAINGLAERLDKSSLDALFFHLMDIQQDLNVIEREVSPS